jgi:hypothetical protein
MAFIIVKGSPFVRGSSVDKDDWSRRKDKLHKRRKVLETELRETIFSKDKMMMRDCKNEREEERRVVDYGEWKNFKDNTGKSNEDKLREWSEINREFKQHNEEGNKHDADQLRDKKPVNYL